MPRKTKPATADQAALPLIPAGLREKLIPGPVTPGQLEDIFQKFKTFPLLGISQGAARNRPAITTSSPGCTPSRVRPRRRWRRRRARTPRFSRSGLRTHAPFAGRR